ncbi:MAG: protein phosphatase CheZ, partial [Deltaproteobacteria bacterium]|nr:protein phosphatase CheZ [Deltaproteobacteria bacterium]
MSASPPVIGFEVGVGEFRIVTPEAVYEIRVIPELVRANTAMGVVSPAAGQLPQPPAASALPAAHGSAAGLSGGDVSGFFQEISQELFDRVGQLARHLSVSVNELPMEDSGGIQRTGADLEDAKGQLEEVVEITEKASLQIMDIADLIQADMESLNGELKVLSDLGFQGKAKDGFPAPEGGAGDTPAPAGGAGEFLEKLARLMELSETAAAAAAALSDGGAAEG